MNPWNFPNGENLSNSNYRNMQNSYRNQLLAAVSIGGTTSSSGTAAPPAASTSSTTTSRRTRTADDYYYAAADPSSTTILTPHRPTPRAGTGETNPRSAAILPSSPHRRIFVLGGSSSSSISHQQGGGGTSTSNTTSTTAPAGSTRGRAGGSRDPQHHHQQDRHDVLVRDFIAATQQQQRLSTARLGMDRQQGGGGREGTRISYASSGADDTTSSSNITGGAGGARLVVQHQQQQRGPYSSNTSSTNAADEEEHQHHKDRVTNNKTKPSDHQYHNDSTKDTATNMFLRTEQIQKQEHLPPRDPGASCFSSSSSSSEQQQRPPATSTSTTTSTAGNGSRLLDAASPRAGRKKNNHADDSDSAAINEKKPVPPHAADHDSYQPQQHQENNLYRQKRTVKEVDDHQGATARIVNTTQHAYCHQEAGSNTKGRKEQDNSTTTKNIGGAIGATTSTNYSTTAAPPPLAQPGIGTAFAGACGATTSSGMLLGAAGSARRNSHFISYPSSSSANENRVAQSLILTTAPAPLSTGARMMVAGGSARYEDGRRLLVANAHGARGSSAAELRGCGGMITSTGGANSSTIGSMPSSASSRMIRGGNTTFVPVPSNVRMLGIRSSSFGRNNNYANTSLMTRRNNALRNSTGNNADTNTMVGGGGLSFTDRVNIASASQLLANQDHDMQGRISGMLGPNSLQQHSNAAMFVSNANTAGTAGVRYYSIDGTGLRDNFSSFRSGVQNDIRLNREFLPRASNTGVASSFPGNEFINRSFHEGQAAGSVNDVSFIYSSRVALTPEEEEFRWMAQLYALRRFKEEFGHCNVPISFKANPGLGQFVHHQRQLYRLYKSSKGDESCGLKATQVKLLEDIGFACRKKPGVLWMAQFNLLKKFEKEHGHVHVPMHYKNDKRLGHWVNNQRQLYRKYKTGLPTSMNESRIELLESLGFAWVLGKDWKEKRKEAVESSNISSSADTPIEEEQSIGEEAIDEGDDQISFDQQEDDTYPPEDASLPSEIKMDKDDNVRKLTPKPKDDNVQQPIKRKLSAEPTGIIEDQDRSRSSSQQKKQKIPRIEVGGRTLSHVLFSTNPAEFDSDISSRTSDDDSDDDDEDDGVSSTRRQEMPGIKIRNRYNTDKHWKKRFEDLVSFKSTHGHVNVPFQYTENKSLSYWVSNQRQKHRQFVKGKPTTLTKERIDSLTSLGFKFNIRDFEDGTSENIPAVQQTLSLWEVRMSEMKAYKRRYGNCLVPALYLPNKQLGTWVINQRQQYRKIKHGENSSLTNDKIAQLENIGFVWVVSRGRKPWKRNSEEKVYLPGDNHIGELDKDLICRILSFVLDVKDIVSFLSISKYYFALMNNGGRTNVLFMECFKRRYGSQRLMSLAEYEVSDDLSWLDAWKDGSKFEKALGLQMNVDEGNLVFASSDDETSIYERNKSGINILSRREEYQALLADNTDLVPANDSKKYCSGYSGIAVFYAQLPPSAENEDSTSETNYKEQVAVWGDFNGLQVIQSVDALFSSERDGSTDIHSIGESRFGRVSTVVSAPQFLMSHKISYHPRRPCVYMGCESGSIVGIFPVPGDNTSIIEYGVSAMTYSHTKSVMALSILPASKVVGGSDVLISAGEDGKVIVYPNSFSARPHQFELHTRITCCENKAPITALASTEIDTSLFLFTGDEAGKTIMWKLRPSISRVKNSFKFEPIFKLPTFSGAQITKLDIFHNNVLVSGSTTGDVQVWDVVEKKTYSKKNRKVNHNPNARFRMSQRFLVPIAHSGKITSLSCFGDVLLTTGGNDGVTKAWSIASGDGDLIGTIESCRGVASAQLLAQDGIGHTERRVYSYEGLRSAVLTNIFIGCSMISLCRDGSLCRWRYGDLFGKHLTAPQEAIVAKSKRCAYCEFPNSEDAAFCKGCNESISIDKNGEAIEESGSDGSDEEDESDSDSGFDWKCPHCNVTNTTSFTRCSSCYSWRST